MSPLFLAGVVSPAVLLILLAAGLPIAFSLMLVGLGGLAILEGLKVATHGLAIMAYDSVVNFLWTCVPLFILMGHFAFAGGLAEKAYAVGYKWVGQFRGGLAMASTIACGFFAAATGSSVATAATMGKIAISEMERYGYDSGYACGAVAAGGTLGILIPPSIPLVIYGIVTEESIGKLLMAGFLPGILTVLSYSATIWITAKIKPRLAPVSFSPSPWKERLLSLPKLYGVAILIIVVMGGIYFGIATPTEAAALGALAALLLAIRKIKRDSGLAREAAYETVLSTSMVYFIMVGASLFTLFLVSAGLPAFLTDKIVALPAPRLVILTLLLLFYIPLGMFLDPISILLITIPLAYPVITGLGFNGIWFGVIVVKMIEIGLMTPPVGINVFVIKGIAPHVPIDRIFWSILPFVVADLVVVAILTAFPEIVLLLPEAMWS